MRRHISIIILILIFILLLTGCSNQQKKTISIAEQYGLAYAPVQIMKEKGYLKKNYPGLNTRWKKLSNTAAIRESMLAGNIDVGFMAIPPFLIGCDKGMKWKIISGLSISPLGLNTYKENINSIDDITEEDRIALPQPGSIQHILLAMACKREFADPTRFDNILVTMAHPDGMNALLSRKEITAHFTSPPYLFAELTTDNVRQILSGKEAMGGEFTFIIGAGTEQFRNNKPQVYQAFVKSLQQSIKFINHNPQEAAAILASKYDLTEERTLSYITWPGMQYTGKVKGLAKFASFMQESGYIDQRYDNIKEVIWEEGLYVE